MFLTKEDRRRLWRARVIYALQATALATAGIILFALALWVSNH